MGFAVHSMILRLWHEAGIVSGGHEWLVLRQTAHPQDRCKSELMLWLVIKLCLPPALSILRTRVSYVSMVPALRAGGKYPVWHKKVSWQRRAQLGPTGGVLVS
jgi:hypothetical protein